MVQNAFFFSPFALSIERKDCRIYIIFLGMISSSSNNKVISRLMVFFFFQGWGHTILLLLSTVFLNYLKNITISFLTMEEVLENWRKLSLTESEGAKVSLKKAKNLLAKDHVLAAKFLTKRALNVEAIGRTFKPLWRSNGEFTIREVEDHQHDPSAIPSWY